MRIAIAVQYCAEWTKKRMIENVREIDTTYIRYFTVENTRGKEFRNYLKIQFCVHFPHYF